MNDIFGMLGNHVDLKKILEEDELYKQVCASLPEDQREKIQTFVLQYIESLQTGMWEPMLKMFNDQEFTTALYNMVEQRNSASK